ncbi:hypothetical protein HAX54_035624, partial [Datura stramonium]|nr:hypothetical protein [Datura stramonium]
MTFGDSSVESGETPMERWSKALFALFHYLDLVLHWGFADQYRQVAALSSVHPSLHSLLSNIGMSSIVRRFLLRLASVPPMLL